MCSYDALICPCPVIGDWVRIDQTQVDCSREHDCLPGQVCPIEGYFQTTHATLSESPQRCRARLVDALMQRF